MWIKMEDRINVMDRKNMIKNKPSFEEKVCILKNFVQEKYKKKCVEKVIKRTTLMNLIKFKIILAPYSWFCVKI